MTLRATWGESDRAAVEEILKGVNETSVPRIREVLALLARVLNPAEEETPAVALDPCDPVLTDAMRCILAHRWLVPSIEKTDGNGKKVRSFFTQPFKNGQVLSLYSSSKAYEQLLREAAKVGARLLPVPLSFGQVMMAHIPNMGVEALKKANVPASNAVRFLSFDPQTHPEQHSLSPEPTDDIVMFSEHEFGFLQSFCHCFNLAGNVLEVAELLAKDPASVAVQRWIDILGGQSLYAIMTAEAAFSNDVGLCLFCYPGDASKVLAYHQHKGTKGLDDAKVKPFEPDDALELIRWQAQQGGAALISATVMQHAEDLQFHGLLITSQTFLDAVQPAFDELAAAIDLLGAPVVAN